MAAEMVRCAHRRTAMHCHAVPTQLTCCTRPWCSKASANVEGLQPLRCATGYRTATQEELDGKVRGRPYGMHGWECGRWVAALEFPPFQKGGGPNDELGGNVR